MTGTGGHNQVLSVIVATALIAVGALAIVFPYIATFSSKLFIGSFLVISGLVKVFHGIGSAGLKSTFWETAIGALEAVSGAFLLIYPVAGVMALTLYLAGVLIVAGLMRAFFALRLRSQPGWMWVLASGLVTLAIGLMLLARLPGSAFWAIGLLMGINIAMYGLMLLAIALAPDPAGQVGAKA